MPYLELSKLCVAVLCVSGESVVFTFAVFIEGSCAVCLSRKLCLHLYAARRAARLQEKQQQGDAELTSSDIDIVIGPDTETVSSSITAPNTELAAKIEAETMDSDSSDVIPPDRVFHPELGIGEDPTKTERYGIDWWEYTFWKRGVGYIERDMYQGHYS